MKRIKLNTRGFSHDFLLVLFVVVFAIIGVGYLVASRAATTAYTSTNEWGKFQYGVSSGTTAALTHANSSNLLLQFNKGITGYHPTDTAWYQFTLPANTTADSLSANVSYVDAGYDTVFIATGSPSNRVWSYSKAGTVNGQNVSLTFPTSGSTTKPTVIYFGIAAKGSSGGFSGTFPGNRNLTVNSYTLKGTTTTADSTPTVSLSANPTSISSGGSSTLSWSSTNATGCTASGAWSGSKATSGSVSTGALQSSATYTLTCTGTGGSNTASTTVNVGASGGGGGTGGGGSLTWLGSLVSGSASCGLSTSIYPVQSCVPGHVTIVSDPDGSGRKVLQFAITNSDQPYSGSLPRADVFSPYNMAEGNDYYISIPVKIPTGLPRIVENGSSTFMQWFQIDHAGEPSNPIVGGYIRAGSDTVNHYQFRFMNTGFTYPSQPWSYDVASWSGPPVDGKWHTLIFHDHFTTSNSGVVELWWDGVRQTFNGGAQSGKQTATGITLQCAHYLCPEGLDINEYRASNWYSGTLTLYHGVPAIGPTLQSVEDTLGSPTGP